MEVYVVTYIIHGWDPIAGVFSSFKNTKQYCEEEFNMANLDLDDALYTNLNHIKTVQDLNDFLEDTNFVVHVKYMDE